MDREARSVALALLVGLGAVLTAVACGQAPTTTRAGAGGDGGSTNLPPPASPRPKDSADGKNRRGRIRSSLPLRTPPRTRSAAGGSPPKQTLWAPQLDVSSASVAGGGSNVPEERLFAELIAGGQLASASLQRNLGHAGQLLGQHIAAAPISPQACQAAGRQHWGCWRV